ncbi:arfaptin-2 isoform X2 [Danaus plexippus]|uniref:arfaptin-2 isoform X2 n=1 Tax=Danaus plexippus TaxID=13037 RepID=UPI0013C3FFA9|nr:arfaptin-2 isoform X2 [Danaus plexippus]
MTRQSERSIHEMLKDTPPLRESSDSITSGTEAKFPTSRSMPFPPAYAPPDVSQNGAGSSTLLRAGSTKIESIKNWSVSTYKCTKQLLYEKLGKSSRTVDTELEAQIEMLRETQRKYAGVLRLSAALAAQLGAAAATQRALGEAFADLAQKSPELQNQFLYNADTQRSLTRNGETLLAALHFFNNSLNTLTNKTMEDTLLTIRQYEAARVEYDAYRSELEASGGNPPELLLASIERHRRHYERLRDDSAVKLQLLHENRVKVMNKQLLLFHNAVSAYFSGNNVALEAAVKHFSVPGVPQHVTHPPALAPHPPPLSSHPPALPPHSPAAATTTRTT